MILEREIDLINTFVVPQKRERYIGFLRVQRRRQDFLKRLYHFSDFVPAYVVPLKVGTAEMLLSELRRRGAPDDCYVISVDTDLDATTGQLQDVIATVHTGSDGTLVSCVPGRLAYYQGEDGRSVLDRTNAQRR